VSAQFLDEYARELERLGERAFRRKHAVPVLVVSGRIAPVRKPRRPGAGAMLDTARERPDGVRALISRVYPLAKLTGTVAGPIVVGRAPGDGIDVVIADPSISKRHCELTPAGDAVSLVDCASTNGTAVNGAPLQGGTPARLCGGEVNTLGRVEMTFETSARFVELVSRLGGARR
jgi:hypothetical protein